VLGKTEKLGNIDAASNMNGSLSAAVAIFIIVIIAFWSLGNGYQPDAGLSALGE